MRRVALAFATLFALAGLARADDAPTPFSKSPPGEALPKGWSHISLPYGNKSSIGLVSEEGVSVLRVGAADSFGMAAAPVDLDVQDNPVLEWRWKIDHVIAGADMEKKEREDFAARVYVSFDYPMDKLSISSRTKITIARKLYDFVPTAAICYVWDNKHAVGTSIWSPHFDHVRVVVLESGNAKAGKWAAESRDVLADFRAAFPDWKGPPPHVNGITVGNDTDQTDESVTAWFGDLSWKPGP